jgi:hypothetical protein
MAKISGWEKFRKAVTGSYSERLTLAIAQEGAAKKAAAIAVERAKVSAGTGKVASSDAKKPAAKKVSAPKKATTTKKPAAKKPAAKKK